MKKNQNLDLSVRVTYKDGSIKEYPNLEEASNDSGLSESALKIRANKSIGGSSSKKDRIHVQWLNEHTFRHFNAKKSRNKGKNYELTIIKELTELGYSNLSSSRQSSRAWDNAKVDIYDPDNQLSCYVQAKATANVPNISKINQEVGLTDKPLAIFWNKQNNSTIREEFVIIPKEYFYNLIKK